MIQTCSYWHESGHALIAELTGIDVRAVHVYESGDIAGAVDRGFVRRGCHPDCFGLMMAAGQAAEWLYWGEHRKAWEHASGDREGMAVFKTADRTWRGWVIDARDMLEEHRSTWERIAGKLAERGSLTGSEVRAVMA